MEADSAKFWVQLAFTWDSGTLLGETGRCFVLDVCIPCVCVCVSIPYMYMYIDIDIYINIHILYIYIYNITVRI